MLSRAHRAHEPLQDLCNFRRRLTRSRHLKQARVLLGCPSGSVRPWLRHHFFAFRPLSTSRRIAWGREGRGLGWSLIQASIGLSSAGGIRTITPVDPTDGLPGRLFPISVVIDLAISIKYQKRQAEARRAPRSGSNLTHWSKPLRSARRKSTTKVSCFSATLFSATCSPAPGMTGLAPYLAEIDNSQGQIRFLTWPTCGLGEACEACLRAGVSIDAASPP